LVEAKAVAGFDGIEFESWLNRGGRCVGRDRAAVRWWVTRSRDRYPAVHWSGAAGFNAGFSQWVAASECGGKHIGILQRCNISN